MAKESGKNELCSNKNKNGAPLKAIKHNKDDIEMVPLELRRVPVELRGDKEFVLAAIKEGCPGAFEDASDELKNDKEVVLAAVEKTCGGALKHASDKLKNDKEFVLAAAKDNWPVLKYASDKLKNDKEFVLAAVKICGVAFYECASDELKNDKEVVLAAIKEGGHWSVLKDASDELKNDKEVVLAAVEKCGAAFKYASDELKNDKEVVLAAVKNVNDSRLIVRSGPVPSYDPELVEYIKKIVDHINIYDYYGRELEEDIKRNIEKTTIKKRVV